ncbi:MAG: hypothetical protein EAZ95_02505 [Bacteroidetes bacterium]|nr:MAG: hypothetical protein EAZ95_02505 [Bacteroidota bacterium]
MNKNIIEKKKKTAIHSYPFKKKEEFEVITSKKEQDSYIKSSKAPYTSILDEYGGIRPEYEKHPKIAKYKSADVIFGKILEVTEDKVLVKCLINEEDRTFQMRKFDIEPFEGAVTLEVNQFVEITIQTGVGERRFTYKNASRKDLPTIFERKNYLEGLENSAFFTAISSSKDENNL